MIHKPIRWIKKKFTTVMELRDDKTSVAAGIAIGFFWGFTPLLGLKTILAFLTAWATRKNKIAAVAAVSAHDLFLPIYPFYLDLSYRVGSLILGTEYPKAFGKALKLIGNPLVGHSHEGWLTWLHKLWDNIHLLNPLLLGTTLLAIPPCVATYFISLYTIDRLAAIQAHKEGCLRRAHEDVPYQHLGDKPLVSTPKTGKGVAGQKDHDVEDDDRRARREVERIRHSHPHRRRNDPDHN